MGPFEGLNVSDLSQLVDRTFRFVYTAKVGPRSLTKEVFGKITSGGLIVTRDEKDEIEMIEILFSERDLGEGDEETFGAVKTVTKRLIRAIMWRAGGWYLPIKNVEHDLYKELWPHNKGYNIQKGVLKLG